MNLGFESLEKLIKGHKRPKRPLKEIKGHQRPKLQKPLILSLFNVKCSIYWNEIIRKSNVLKVGIFHFQYIKFLKLHFVQQVKWRILSQPGKIGSGKNIFF